MVKMAMADMATGNMGARQSFITKTRQVWVLFVQAVVIVAVVVVAIVVKWAPGNASSHRKDRYW